MAYQSIVFLFYFSALRFDWEDISNTKDNANPHFKHLKLRLALFLLSVWKLMKSISIFDLIVGQSVIFSRQFLRIRNDNCKFTVGTFLYVSNFKRFILMFRKFQNCKMVQVPGLVKKISRNLRICWALSIQQKLPDLS